MSNTKFPKVEIVKDPELQFSYAYKVTRPYRLPFYVPVIDVRDGASQRALAYSILKASNSNKGSKFIKRNF